MKIPKTLQIGDNLWSIRRVSKIPENKKDTWGLCDPSEFTIYLRTKLSYAESLDTLLHEIIHALEFELNFNLKHAHVYKLAEGLAHLWLNNF